MNILSFFSLLPKEHFLNIAGISPNIIGKNKDIPKLIKLIFIAKNCVFLNIVKRQKI